MTARPRALTLAISLAAVYGWHSVPWYVGQQTWPLPDALAWLNGSYWISLCYTAYSAALALPTPRRSGLCFGSIREHWRGVLLVCGGPVLVTACVYPFLAVRPYADSSSTM